MTTKKAVTMRARRDKAHWPFVERLRTEIAVLENRGVSRQQVCERAGLTRNTITNFLINDDARPEFGTVVRLVESLMSFGITWDVPAALEAAGFGTPLAQTTPREPIDVMPLSITTMRLPVFDAVRAGEHGAYAATVAHMVDLHTGQILFEGLHRTRPEMLTLVDTIGDIQPHDIVVAREDDHLITCKLSDATVRRQMVLGRVMAYLFGPSLLLPAVPAYDLAVVSA